MDPSEGSTKSTVRAMWEKWRTALESRGVSHEAVGVVSFFVVIAIVFILIGAFNWMRGMQGTYQLTGGDTSMALQSARAPSPISAFGSAASNVTSSMMPAAQSGSAPGGNAENYTVAQYTANIETTQLKSTCDAIYALRPREDVVFENARTNDTSCSFTFKVKHESVQDVLGIIKGLNPKDLSENEYTIEQQVQDYATAEESLMKQRDAIDDTLSKATTAYNEVTSLATQSQNADALAKVIKSKIDTIQSLTQQRISIDNQLAQIARTKAQQLDKIDYTYFNVSVTELQYINWKQISDSWKNQVQRFVVSLNSIFQAMTLGLLLSVTTVLQWALYLLLALFALKYGLKILKHLWYL